MSANAQPRRRGKKEGTAERPKVATLDTFDPFANATPPTAPQPGARPTGRDGQREPVLDLSNLDLAMLTPARLDAIIPRPHDRESTGDTLTFDARDELERCEHLLRFADLAFWVRGRVLATIRQAGLYIEQYDTFEDYARIVWKLSKARAYQLMDAWELAEFVANTPLHDGTVARVNEGQIRELVPFARQHGQAAATLVYRLTAEYAPSVTAKTLAAAVGALPDDFDEDQAAQRIKAHFAGQPTVVDEPPADAIDAKLHRAVVRITRLAHDPASARRIADELEEAARNLRAEYSAE